MACIGELFQRTISGELRLPVEAIYDLADVADVADVAEAARATRLLGRKGKILLKP